VAIKTASGPAGIWLTDQTGRTLYIYTTDQGTTSACYNACATAWPPLVATGSVTVNGQFLDQSLVGSTTRTDGTTQVTYGGHPLYYFKSDVSPGDVKGQGVGGVWYILGPKANIMK
jgi:predicted lipoprotein with Yx(FWY)xxD motif